MCEIIKKDGNGFVEVIEDVIDKGDDKGERDVKIYKDADGSEITLEKAKTSDNEDEKFLSRMRIEIILRKLRYARSYNDVSSVLDESLSGCKREYINENIERMMVFPRDGIGGYYNIPHRCKMIFDWIDEWNHNQKGTMIRSLKLEDGERLCDWRDRIADYYGDYRLSRYKLHEILREVSEQSYIRGMNNKS